ncbi:hypothetical protein Poli38472_010540 [Pythium oligandrum]|uniref:Uncharacterized protein n=1 Tax=Pythium oligandrum TaxID=41045 RepID=A0A8K1C3G2_PYTOL|nr:hypothetical protein Poli38472_010540 [Pythium oligandrum]|eukprot:TMW55658.1 hypothetical protein Poli38472_010540 [Pythium oligandrum]
MHAFEADADGEFEPLPFTTDSLDLSSPRDPFFQSVLDILVDEDAAEHHVNTLFDEEEEPQDAARWPGLPTLKILPVDPVVYESSVNEQATPDDRYPVKTTSLSVSPRGHDMHNSKRLRHQDSQGRAKFAPYSARRPSLQKDNTRFEKTLRSLHFTCTPRVEESDQVIVIDS